MASDTQGGSAGRRTIPWRAIGWGSAAFILLLPLVAMQFTREVNWTAGDFVFAILLIGGTGVLFELTVRVSRNASYRAGVAAALASAFLIVWANGAVGMIGNEDNPYNLLFLAVIPLALVGATAARFRPGGMAVAMLAAGVGHAGIALGGMSADMRGGAFSLGLGFLWLLSAAFFRNASEDLRLER